MYEYILGLEILRSRYLAQRLLSVDEDLSLNIHLLILVRDGCLNLLNARTFNRKGTVDMIIRV
jgi:hypothetical protein